MLAYSSIAHGGYLLVALVGRQRRRPGVDPVLPARLRGHQPRRVRDDRAARQPREAAEILDDYKGLWHASPSMAGLLTIFLLSLGGFPPTAGFVAKWYVFSAAVAAGPVRPGDRRRAHQRRLRLLLPARRRDDVHDGYARSRRARRARRAPRWSRCRSRRLFSSTWACCRRGSSTWRRGRSPACSREEGRRQKTEARTANPRAVRLLAAEEPPSRYVLLTSSCAIACKPCRGPDLRPRRPCAGRAPGDRARSGR